MTGATTRIDADRVRIDSADAEALRIFSRFSQRDWCELIRDVVAAANSGGGTLLIHAPGESSATLELSTDGLIRRIREFTGSSFNNLIVRPVERDGIRAIRIAVGPAALPIGFAKSGCYLDATTPGRNVEVFPAGSFYFRHGDRSEPATEADLRRYFERLLSRVRRQWVHGIRRAISMPVDALLQQTTTRTSEPHPRESEQLPNLKPVRIVDDPNAPALQPQDVDRLYPYRQKDVVAELNRRIGRRALTTYDIQAVRRQHHLDERPDFVFHLLGAGRRYSPAMIDWAAARWERDPEFFTKARADDQKMLRLRRKPR